jgi:stage II sporulation protein D
MLKEMPSGKGNENYEALKAFSICARTYAYLKIFERKTDYDIFPDTRDQVYGGVDGESDYTNNIVDETRSQILTFTNEPAIIFYHSTCGGNTESASNVFTNVDVDYLKGVKDGSPSNCMISPRYEWTEIIPEYKIINYLKNRGLINNNNYSIKVVKINSRFNSGRVKEMEFKLSSRIGEEISVKLFGNNIRSVIRTADNKSILRSSYFEISQASDGNIVIKGKGSGHGVGLCQWGAINLSRKGIGYEEILEHYYPGTQINKIDDK